MGTSVSLSYNYVQGAAALSGKRLTQISEGGLSFRLRPSFPYPPPLGFDTNGSKRKQDVLGDGFGV